MNLWCVEGCGILCFYRRAKYTENDLEKFEITLKNKILNIGKIKSIISLL